LENNLSAFCFAMPATIVFGGGASILLFKLIKYWLKLREVDATYWGNYRQRPVERVATFDLPRIPPRSDIFANNSPHISH